MALSDGWARAFDDRRPRLRALALRMLGVAGDADDAVQEAWLKVSRTDAAGLDNLDGFLTTVVARVCLDMLRAHRARGEQPLARAPEIIPTPGTPELELALADALGPALLVVLETLAPLERVAFVLHDMFDMSFEEIAPIVDRTPAAARQLASRARRRVRGAPSPDAELTARGEVVNAFLAASRTGDLARLLAVLSPDAVLRADATAVRVATANRQRGGPDLAPEIRGAAPIAHAFKGSAAAARPALVDGAPGAVWEVNGRVLAVFVFGIAGATIVSIELVMDPERLAKLDVASGQGW